ncbi:hypothetical protein Anapl_02491 [Anas platyrhynchos]|uniref:Uncharacterized protein n=1 Tax=Anas platyrhynchos TaxID=8839 RepID=R0LGF3_ANAPL|nr:hypothetical protein Anapl_02491 [Anas platyrhynchos]
MLREQLPGERVPLLRSPARPRFAIQFIALKPGTALAERNKHVTADGHSSSSKNTSKIPQTGLVWGFLGQMGFPHFNPTWGSVGQHLSGINKAAQPALQREQARRKPWQQPIPGVYTNELPCPLKSAVRGSAPLRPAVNASTSSRPSPPGCQANTEPQKEHEGVLAFPSLCYHCWGRAGLEPADGDRAVPLPPQGCETPPGRDCQGPALSSARGSLTGKETCHHLPPHGTQVTFGLVSGDGHSPSTCATLLRSREID